LHSYKRVTPESVAATVPDELVRAASIVGPAAEARVQLQAFLDAGATPIMIDSPQPAASLLAALSN
jgi:hypothetical protein